ncbi:beta-lactamase superfamily domain-containing protein [Flagelloscypha sp. PMI_526]|nr:beta-lactamase superfamily domain-containing protein [Flagelloscypha sp. PMI_526]
MSFVSREMLSLKTDHGKSAIGVVKPTWGSDVVAGSSKIRASWLGHACLYVQMPGSQSSRGAKILFDPVFSDRCSPSQHVGPKRFTPAPCDIEDIPEIDAVVISHNHYDHLDTHTIKTLAKRAKLPHFFAPLGNKPYFTSLGIPTSHIHILDWWDSLRVQSVDNTFSFDITCTPSQHRTGRSMTDQNKTYGLVGLWRASRTARVKEEAKCILLGIQPYRAVTDKDKVGLTRLCRFVLLSRKLGTDGTGFDFAMIPIGAYQPRVFMSSQHASPPQSVHIFKDIRARHALGMHWGTWVLTTEEITEPPQLLKESLEKHGIDQERFTVCSIGETRVYDVLND